MAAAKEFQLKRCQFIEQVWQKDRDLQSWGFYADDDDIQSAMHRFQRVIRQAVDIKQLLAGEAIFMKSLYKYASEHVDMPDFVRLHDAPAGDKANIFLNHGNYLAYGLAAVTLWILGIPHGFAVMHGKTRRCPAAGFALAIAANSSGWWETATNSMKKAWCRSIQREIAMSGSIVNCWRL